MGQNNQNMQMHDHGIQGDAVDLIHQGAARGNINTGLSRQYIVSQKTERTQEEKINAFAQPINSHH